MDSRAIVLERRGDGRGWIAAAALSGGAAVIAGAFAAHGLDPVIDAKPIEWLHIGSQYEALHALALLVVTALVASARVNRRTASVSQWLFLGGGFMFPGALYGLALGGPRWLGAIAPIGGTLLILGWVALAVAALARADD